MAEIHNSHEKPGWQSPKLITLVRNSNGLEFVLTPCKNEGVGSGAGSIDATCRGDAVPPVCVDCNIQSNS